MLQSRAGVWENAAAAAVGVGLVVGRLVNECRERS